MDSDRRPIFFFLTGQKEKRDKKMEQKNLVTSVLLSVKKSHLSVCEFRTKPANQKNGFTLDC